MNTSKVLQHKIIEELEWDPSVDAAHIGVEVRDSVVTLTGSVTNYLEKVATERAAKRIAGVRAVANDIEVRPALPSQRNDTEIAQAVVNALTWDIAIPHDRIKTRVADGWVRLEGQVPYHFQRVAAEEAVRRLTGVRGVSNTITITAAPRSDDIQIRIEAAFRRSAEVDASKIQVETDGDKVILRGKVRNWAEREEAERATWAAPGVARVADELTIGT